ncbi:MAG: hypothetical protein EP298_10860 [Gammaproteobacteria bacterium]|nr:MAG: hypothetical protein EP298_10860 [Gammaproteobacteria bacterium]UTW41623.1 hypothetical protein KFE69_08900 [bacterium SCSIO 12844]
MPLSNMDQLVQQSKKIAKINISKINAEISIWQNNKGLLLVSNNLAYKLDEFIKTYQDVLILDKIAGIFVKLNSQSLEQLAKYIDDINVCSIKSNIFIKLMLDKNYMPNLKIISKLLDELEEFDEDSINQLILKIVKSDQYKQINKLKIFHKILSNVNNNKKTLDQDSYQNSCAYLLDINIEALQENEKKHFYHSLNQSLLLIQFNLISCDSNNSLLELQNKLVKKITSDLIGCQYIYSKNIEMLCQNSEVKDELIQAANRLSPKALTVLIQVLLNNADLKESQAESFFKLSKTYLLDDKKYNRSPQEIKDLFILAFNAYSAYLDSLDANNLYHEISEKEHGNFKNLWNNELGVINHASIYANDILSKLDRIMISQKNLQRPPYPFSVDKLTADEVALICIS